MSHSYFFAVAAVAANLNLPSFSLGYNFKPLPTSCKSSMSPPSHKTITIISWLTVAVILFISQNFKRVSCEPAGFFEQLTRYPHYDLNRYPFLLGPDGQTIAPRDYMDLESTVFADMHQIASIGLDRHLYNIEKGVEFASLYTHDYWNYSRPEYIDQAIVGKPASFQECGAHLDWLLSKIVPGLSFNSVKDLGDNSILIQATNESVQLVQLIDSFGRVQPNMYKGNIYWFGSYRHCLEVKLPINITNGTRYCLGKVILKSWRKLYQEDNFTPKVTIKVGLCLPYSCHQRAALHGENLAKIEQLMMVNFSPIDRERFQLMDIYCLPEQNSPWRQFSWQAKLWLAFVCLWLTLVLIASLWVFMVKGGDHHNEKKQQHNHHNNKNKKQELQQIKPVTSDHENWIQVMCIQRNVHDLLAWPKEKSQQETGVNLIPLDFIRVMGTFFILFSHTMIMLGIYPVQVVNAIEATHSIFLNIGTSAQRTVDTFLMMTGFLAGYHLMKRFYKRPERLYSFGTWFQVQFLRYLRLAPMYMLVYYFTKHIIVHLDKGPNWDYGTNDAAHKALCRNDEWWRSILYFINVGGDFTARCSITSWYLAVDVQIFLIIPFALYIIVRAAKSGLNKWLIGSVVMLTFLEIMRAISQQDVGRPESVFVISYYFSGTLLFKYGSQLHFSVVLRGCLVIVGLYAGERVFDYEQKLLDKCKKDADFSQNKRMQYWSSYWPRFITNWKIFNFILIVNCIVFILPALTMTINKWTGFRMNSATVIIFVGITTILWLTCQAIIIVRFTTQPVKQWWPTRATITSSNSNELDVDVDVDQMKYFNIFYWPGWKIVARITYIMFLTHIDVIYHTMMSHYSSDTLVGITNINVVKVNSYITLATTLISAQIFVLFELPMYKWTKILIKSIN